MHQLHARKHAHRLVFYVKHALTLHTAFKLRMPPNLISNWPPGKQVVELFAIPHLFAFSNSIPTLEI